MSHVTHAVGQASSQQRLLHSTAHPSVLGVACPPQWLPMLLALASPPPSLPPRAVSPQSPYTFVQGTFQPPPSGSALGCTDLDELLGAELLTKAIDVCFDDGFSCSHAKPFVGMGMIEGFSTGSPQAGEQARVQLEGSDSWLPALVPLHAPRGSRRTTRHPVPVVGCLVDNDSRFVLSWADVRCRSSTTSTLFPAECDGASQRSVAIEDTSAAVSFVNSLASVSRRKLDLGDTDSDFVVGTKTAIMVIMHPSDQTAAEAWSSTAWHHHDLFLGSPTTCVDQAVHQRYTS